MGASAVLEDNNASSGIAVPPSETVGIWSRLLGYLAPRARIWGLLVPLNLVAFALLYLASVRLQEGEALSAASETARRHLEHEAADLQAMARLQTGDQEGGHPFASLISSHDVFDTQLHLASGRVLSSRDGVALISPELLESFLASGETWRQWLSQDGGTTQMNGLKRIVATPDCAPCHEIGSTRAVASLSFDLSEIMSAARGRTRRQMALVIVTWALILTLITALVRRLLRRSIRSLEADLEAIEAGSRRLPQPDQEALLDPVTSRLHEDLREFLRRQQERRQEASRQLAESDRLASLGELTIGLAQGIKNPLAGVQGVLEVLGQESSESTNASLFEEMIARLRGVDRTLQTVLSFAEAPDPAFQRVEVRTYLEQMVESFRDVLESRGVSLEIDTPEQGFEALLDPKLTQRAIAILIENASEALESGGTIRLEAGALPAARGTLISVTDNGPGIDLEDQHSIFEPFTTTKHSRCGLGLALARRLMQHQGGSLEVDSNLGEGARFLLVIPVPEEPTPPAAT